MILKNLRRLSYILVATLGIYSAFGFLVLPMLARSQIKKLIATNLTSIPELKRVTFNPMVFDGAFEHFTITSPKGTPLLSVGRIDAELEPSNLFSHQVKLKKLVITELELFDLSSGKGIALLPSIKLDAITYNWKLNELQIGQVTLADGELELATNSKGQLNVARATAAIAARPQLEAPALSPPQSDLPPFNLLIDRVSLIDSRLSYTTTLDGESAAWGAKGIDLQLSKFNLNGDEPLPFTLKLVNNAGGSIESKGTLERSPLTVDLNTTITNLPLREANPLLRASNRQFADGKASAQIKLNLKTSSEFTLTVAGNLTLNAPTLLSQNFTEPEFQAASVTLSEFTYNLAPFSAKASELQIIKPSARVKLTPPPETKSNIEADTPLAAKRELPNLAIGTLTLTDGSLWLENNSTQLHTSHNLTNISLKVTPLSFDEQTASIVNLTARVEGEAPLTLEATTNIKNFPTGTSATLSVDRMPLRPFGPYAARFLGREIKEGKLSAKLTAQSRGTDISGQNTFRIQRLALGRSVPSPEAIQAPIETALALMQDSNGVVTLEIPVEGKSTDPSFRYYKMLGAAVRKALLEVAASPLSLLSNLYNWDADEMSSVLFAQQSSTLAPPEVAKLDSLAKALQEKPVIELEVIGASSPFEFQEPPQSDQLEQLANARATTIRDYLASRGVESNRVYLSDIHTSQPINDGHVAQDLKLKLVD